MALYSIRKPSNIDVPGHMIPIELGERASQNRERTKTGKGKIG
jgi:hypothetical protein